MGRNIQKMRIASLLLVFNFFSCASGFDINSVDDNFIYSVTRGKEENIGIWIFGVKMYLKESEEARDRSWNFSYCIDPVTSKFFTLSKGKNGNVYFYDISSGKIEEELEIVLEYNVSLLFKVYNNKAVLTLVDFKGKYAIVDLISKNVEYVTIDSFEQIFHGQWMKWLYGYDGRSLFFHDGFFDLSSNIYEHYKIELSNPRYLEKERKIIGLDRNNNIVLYDNYTGEIQNTGIKRFLLPGYDYGGASLYYLEGDILYISKDIKNFFNLFVVPARRKWYAYNLKTKKKELITVPSQYAIIVWKHS